MFGFVFYRCKNKSDFRKLDSELIKKLEKKGYGVNIGIQGNGMLEVSIKPESEERRYITSYSLAHSASAFTRPGEAEDFIQKCLEIFWYCVAHRMKKEESIVKYINSTAYGSAEINLGPKQQ